MNLQGKNDSKVGIWSCVSVGPYGLKSHQTLVGLRIFHLTCPTNNLNLKPLAVRLVSEQLFSFCA